MINQLFTPLLSSLYIVAQWLWKHRFEWLFSLLFLYLALYRQVQIQLTIGPSPAPTTPLSTIPAPKSPSPTPINADLHQHRLAYIQRFTAVAQGESRKFHIPASITLAQGLLESNAGQSPLATKNNNHFGIKCFSKHCKKGHCANFNDDSHKDFFRIYPNAWESFRAHSQLLQSNRYRHLQQIPLTDYKAWARGLQQTGYATDPQYANKLIALIERYQLHQLDH